MDITPSVSNLIDGPHLPSPTEQRIEYAKFVRSVSRVAFSLAPRRGLHALVNRDDDRQRLYRAVYDEHKSYLPPLKEKIHEISPRQLDSLERRITKFLRWIPQELTNYSRKQIQDRLANENERLATTTKDLRDKFADPFHTRELVDFNGLQTWRNNEKKGEVISYLDLRALAARTVLRFGQDLESEGKTVRVLVSGVVPPEVSELAALCLKSETPQNLESLKNNLTELFRYCIAARNTFTLFTPEEVKNLSDEDLLRAYTRRMKMSLSDDGAEVRIQGAPCGWALAPTDHDICRLELKLQGIRNTPTFDPKAVETFLYDVIDCIQDEKRRRNEAHHYRRAFGRIDTDIEVHTPDSYRGLIPEQKFTHITTISAALSTADRFSIRYRSRLSDTLVDLAAFELGALLANINPISEDRDSRSRLIDRVEQIAQAPLKRSHKHRLTKVIVSSDLSSSEKQKILKNFCSQSKIDEFFISDQSGRRDSYLQPIETARLSDQIEGDRPL